MAFAIRGFKRTQGGTAANVGLTRLHWSGSRKVLNWTGATQMMNLKPDIFTAIQRSGVTAHMEIDVPSDRDVFFETGVYDWETGKAGTVEVPLLVRNEVKAQQAGNGLAPR